MSFHTARRAARRARAAWAACVLPLLLAVACATEPAGAPLSTVPDDAASAERPLLREPVTARPDAEADGAISLVAQQAGSGSDVAFSYDGERPGKTIRMKPGETTRVLLVNQLDGLNAEQLQALDPPVLRPDESAEVKKLLTQHSAITNLHTHGLHVSPRERSDNVLLKIGPGKKNLYTFELPDDHAPGTHWYHGHLHGSTALQVQAGMSGMLIVDPPKGQELDPEGFEIEHQELLVRLRQGGGSIELGGESDGTAGSSARREMQPPRFAINELQNPRLEVDGQAIQRLRLVNAGSRNANYVELWVDGHEMYLAAFDGINLRTLPKEGEGYLHYDQERPLALAPGNRADVYVLPKGPGSYALRARSDLEVDDLDELGAAGRETFTQTLMTLEVGAGATTAPEVDRSHDERQKEFLDALHERLEMLRKTPPYDKGYLRPFGETPQLSRRLIFDIEPRNTAPPPRGRRHRTFTIGGRDYNELDQHGHMKGHLDFLGRLRRDGPIDAPKFGPPRAGTEERWIVQNTSRARHPFHIHVNPFWVHDIFENVDGRLRSVRQNDPDDPRLDRWQDTVHLPPQGAVEIWNRFSDFAGLFVLHCHILQHEDRGMMMNVLIVPRDWESDPGLYFIQQVQRNRALNEEIERGE